MKQSSSTQISCFIHFILFSLYNMHVCIYVSFAILNINAQQEMLDDHAHNKYYFTFWIPDCGTFPTKLNSGFEMKKTNHFKLLLGFA